MAIRRRPVSTLSASTIAILLAGWNGTPPVDDDAGFGGGFLDLYEGNGIVRLWRQHEPFLRETARTWGWTPRVEGPDGRRRFFAEDAYVRNLESHHSRGGGA